MSGPQPRCRVGIHAAGLVPLRRSRRFVSRQEFAAMSRTAPGVDLDGFRVDQEATADTYVDDPFDR
ncbi:prevent-host-death protein [Streptomyces sp. NPDC086843]|uniref:prevent-host-death protein n=1 Tax=Streptomyces sp. NPDC086843 TaxID=3365763 RepID=UPI00381D6645